MKKYLFSILLPLLINPALGQQYSGSEITYKCLIPDSTIYEVSYTIYRDCSGIGLPDTLPHASVACASSWTTSTPLYPTLHSVQNVTSACDNPPNQCNPSNTFGTGPGLEKLTYLDTIDFSISPFSNYASCTETVFQISECCRNSMLTNMGANTNHYNSASLFLSNFTSNSNIATQGTPLFSFPINVGVRYLHNKPQIDMDSVSYSLKKPLTSRTNTISYSSPFSENEFLSVFYFSGQSYPFNNPNYTPPIGHYFDSKTGDMIFTPTVNNESGVYVIEAVEWRRDTAGTMKKAGISRLEMNFRTTTSASTNNPPKLVAVPSELNKCTDQEVTIAIEGQDLAYIPPPPGAAVLDSLSFNAFCDYPINLVIDTSIVGSTSKVTGRLTFHTDSFDTIPESFDILLYAFETNRCFGTNYAAKRIRIHLYPKAKLSNSVSNLGCGSYSVAANIDTFQDINSLVSVNVKDIFGNSVHTGFVNTNAPDSFQLFNVGTYFIETSASFAFACDSILYDTIFVNLADVYPLPVEDSLFACYKNQETLSVPSKWEKAIWSTGDTTYSINVTRNGSYDVDLYDSCGNISKHTFYVEFRSFETEVMDTISCPSADITFQINPIGGISWTWPDMNASKFYTTNNAGLHTITVYDSICNLTFIDSFFLNHKPLPSAIIDEDTVVLCNNGNVTLKVQFDSTYFYSWSNSTTDTINTIGDPGWHWVDAMNECGSDRDSVFVLSKSSPSVNLKSDTVLCTGDSLEIGVTKNSDYAYLWNDGETSNVKTVSIENDYILTATNICGSTSDTFSLFVIDAPTVDLGNDTAKPEFDLITLRNKTPTRFTTSNWSIGSNADSIQVRLSGTYFLTEINQCGTASDTIVVTYTASIENLKQLGVSIYPNPAHHTLMVKNLSGKSLEFNLIDALGKRVLTDKILGVEKHLDLHALKRGAYIVRFEVEGNIYSTPLIVQ